MNLEANLRWPLPGGCGRKLPPRFVPESPSTLGQIDKDRLEEVTIEGIRG